MSRAGVGAIARAGDGIPATTTAPYIASDTDTHALPSRTIHLQSSTVHRLAIINDYTRSSGRTRVAGNCVEIRTANSVYSGQLLREKLTISPHGRQIVAYAILNW